MTQEKLRDLTQEELNEALSIACRLGDLNRARERVEAGADVNWQNEYGRTPLHYAVFYGRIEIVKFLLKEGAIADVQANEDGSTPLDIAKWGNGNTEIIALLQQALSKEAGA